MINETFFSYRNYRYLWLNVVLLLILALYYLYDNPLGSANGGTFLGLLYGGLATAGILYLMWYGIRKRSYNSKHTTLKGCLSAHAWLGIALSIIVPLHSGFSFGCNVHTLAYVLMMFVILSGIWGSLQYGKLAPEIQAHRGGATIKRLLEQQFLLSNEIKNLAQQKSDAFIRMLNSIDFVYRPSLMASFFGKRPAIVDKSEAGRLLSALVAEEQTDGLKLIGLVNKKHQLITTLMDETLVMSKLRMWLYLHLPISIGLLVAVFIHIFSVFYYR